VRDQCLRILSKICRAKVTLPESYIVSDVVPEKRWKIGGFADIWTGKVKGEDVCLRVFRQHEPQQQAKINGVGRILSGESLAQLRIFLDVLLSRYTVEVPFARERAPFPRHFRGSPPVRPRQPLDAKYRHSGVYQGQPRCRTIILGAHLRTSGENQLTPFSIVGKRCLWSRISSFGKYCARWYQSCERAHFSDDALPSTTDSVPRGAF
jgi:hypothetical protein